MTDLEAYRLWSGIVIQELVALGYSEEEAATEVVADPAYYYEMFTKGILPIRIADETKWMRDTPPD